MQIMYRLYWLTHSLDGDKARTTFTLKGAAREVFGEGFNNIQKVLKELYDRDLIQKAGECNPLKAEFRRRFFSLGDKLRFGYSVTQRLVIDKSFTLSKEKKSWTRHSKKEEESTRILY